MTVIKKKKKNEKEKVEMHYRDVTMGSQTGGTGSNTSYPVTTWPFEDLNLNVWYTQLSDSGIAFFMIIVLGLTVKA